MNRSPRYWIESVPAFVLLILIVAAAALPAGLALAAPDPIRLGNSLPHRIIDNDAVIDANDVRMLLTNRGAIGRDLESPGGPAGTFYPADTDRTCMYTAGVWVGGKVGQEIRVTVAEYDLEYGPGVILPGGGWSDPSLPEYRTYKLTPLSGPGDPDYDEWPVGDGAPVDRDGHPLVVGDQTLWSVFNDADPDGHTNNAGSTPPIGVEVSQLTYAFALPSPLDRVIFLDYRLIHKGLQALNPAFVGIYTDIDLGNGRDDLAGCDSLLEAGFTMNGDDLDDVYGDRPPTTGFVVLKGPAHLAHPLYAAIDYVNGQDPSSTDASYNLLRGLNTDGTPMIDPYTNRPTRFWHAGNVDTGEGWLDWWVQDKRNLLSMGPFAFSPGQVESVRVAFVVGDKDNWIGSTVDMLDVSRCVTRLNAKGAFLQPSRWAIAGFYPQPFHPIEDAPGRIFILAPEAGRVLVRVSDMQNQLVRSFPEQDVAAGINPLEWDGMNDGGAIVAPGTYRFDLRVVKPVLSTRHLIVDSEEMRVMGGRDVAAVSAPGTPVVGGLRVPGIARGGVWITFDGPDRGVAARAVAIYDLGGRVVSRLDVPVDERGAWWDARDAAGRRLPAGFYFVRTDQPAGRSSSKRTLLLW
jgi:hypothetical protein